MSTSADLLAAVAPELASDARVDTFLAMAAQRLSAAAFGDVYTQAAVYLAAHMLTLAADDGGVSADAAGPATSKGAGDLSVSYGAAPGTAGATLGDASLASTKYGREFLALRQSRAATAPTTTLLGWGL